MARYRLTEKSYINDMVLEPETEIGEGTSVPFSGVPGPHMEPLDKDAEKALAAAKEQATKEGRIFDLAVMNTVPIHRVSNVGM